jgi:hypothetical protein
VIVVCRRVVCRPHHAAFLGGENLRLTPVAYSGEVGKAGSIAPPVHERSAEAAGNDVWPSPCQRLQFISHVLPIGSVTGARATPPKTAMKYPRLAIGAGGGPFSMARTCEHNLARLHGTDTPWCSHFNSSRARTRRRNQD